MTVAQITVPDAITDNTPAQATPPAPGVARDDADGGGDGPTGPLASTDTFPARHIGPDEREIEQMLSVIGAASLDELIDQTIPASIRMSGGLDLGPCTDGWGEHEALRDLRSIAQKNIVNRSFIGMGYHGTITPPVILRNILENPGWYTQYTPYQAEIAQGRLEALLNFQTMVCDLTAMEVANASLLDEATAAAEAMIMCDAITGGRGKGRSVFLVADDVHPQTIAVMEARAESNGIDLRVMKPEAFDFVPGDIAGCLVQYPTTDGRIVDYGDMVDAAHASGTLVVASADILALTLLKPPGEWGSHTADQPRGADIVVGSTQRFGVPMGFGGPHAAFMATREQFVRRMPGRIIGVSKDAMGNRCYRMAIQTREQHIKRERATSNICTAQVLLAIMASMYAVYHGPAGLKKIAQRVHALADTLRSGLEKLGYTVQSDAYFDTLRVSVTSAEAVIEAALRRDSNIRRIDDTTVGITVDETTRRIELIELLEAFAECAQQQQQSPNINLDSLMRVGASDIESRRSSYLTHPVFNTHHSETEMLRYMAALQSRDLSLTHSMIPLGSCTMKLNATSEMLPVTWHEFANMHPFAPANQTRGYAELFARLEYQLAEITGLPAVSLQPNAGSQGEYAGLLVIRAYHHARGDTHRDICLIPVSAHGTNPASAVAAGFKVVTVSCDKHGNIDLDDLTAKAKQHADNLAALLVTYPSTHGVFEPNIRDVIAVIHEQGGQVYLDGANMNAQVGLCRPGDYGADVCHLNLHKTFCIPHGGGGPGMGPICAKEHLAPYLPSHPVVPPARYDRCALVEEGRRLSAAGQLNDDQSIGAISAAPYGSPAILPISYMYITMMGARGLRRASEVAILSANYMATRLRDHYSIVYTGRTNRVAHEFIVDCRPFKQAGIEIDDIAKRLMDYGFHAPTMSWPVPGTLMIEPTESEALVELDRFCEAMIAIREEIREIEDGRADREDNPLKHAPHPAAAVVADRWDHVYSRERAAYPLPWLREHKFWPPVARIDNPYGDRNLFCTCPPIESYES